MWCTKPNNNLQSSAPVWHHRHISKVKFGQDGIAVHAAALQGAHRGSSCGPARREREQHLSAAPQAGRPGGSGAPGARAQRAGSAVPCLRPCIPQGRAQLLKLAQEHVVQAQGPGNLHACGGGACNRGVGAPRKLALAGLKHKPGSHTVAYILSTCVSFHRAKLSQRHPPVNRPAARAGAPVQAGPTDSAPVSAPPERSQPTSTSCKDRMSASMRRSSSMIPGSW